MQPQQSSVPPASTSQTSAQSPGTAQSQGAQGAATDSREKRIVKRYSNRKLYDTRESRYVTLLQIAEMVRAGEEVQIIDNATKDDLTEVTLAQIIYEEQKQHSRSVPLQTLRDLIHQRGERFITQLREGPLGRLLPDGSQGQGGEKAEVSTVEEVPVQAAAPVAAATKDDKEKKGLLDKSREALETLQGTIDDRVRSILASFSPIQQLQNEVARLTSRIDELEQKLRAKDAKAQPGRTPLDPRKKD